MVTSSTPTPMPAISRHRLIAGAVVCSAMISVAAEYQSSETVKTVPAVFIGETCEEECADEQARKRRRYERAESRDAEEGRCCRGIEAAFNEAGAYVSGEKQVAEFEPAAEGQQEHQHPDGTRRRQPVDARIDA